MASFVPLAIALREGGHQVSLALREVQRSEPLLAPTGLPILQAPVWHGVPPGAPPEPVNYAEILYHFGYLDAAGLTAMLRAWRGLLALAAPDLVIADHAPTALLAARSLGICRVTFGNGFCVPPAIMPTPNMRPWKPVPGERLVHSEQRVLQVIDQAVAAFAGRPLRALAELFPVEQNLLLCYPELDHYRDRQGGRYCGVTINLTGRAQPCWPDGQGPKVFAYLKPRFADLERVLLTLTACHCRTVVYAGGLPGSLVAQYSSSRVSFSRELVAIRTAVEECDFVVCHAGSGTVAATLLGGKPLLLLPMHLEQLLLSMRVVELGAGLFVEEIAAGADYQGPVRQLAQDDRFACQARHFAERYRTLTQQQITANLVQHCEAALNLSGARPD